MPVPQIKERPTCPTKPLGEPTERDIGTDTYEIHAELNAELRMQSDDES